MFNDATKTVSKSGVGEIAQRLRAFMAFAEDPGSVPSTHMIAHNHL